MTKINKSWLVIGALCVAVFLIISLIVRFVLTTAVLSQDECISLDGEVSVTANHLTQWAGSFSEGARYQENHHNWEQREFFMTSDQDWKKVPFREESGQQLVARADLFEFFVYHLANQPAGEIRSAQVTLSGADAVAQLFGQEATINGDSTIRFSDGTENYAIHLEMYFTNHESGEIVYTVQITDDNPQLDTTVVIEQLFSNNCFELNGEEVTYHPLIQTRSVEALTFRSQPAFGEKFTIPENYEFQVIGINAERGFYQVDYNSQVGWIGKDVIDSLFARHPSRYLPITGDAVGFATSGANVNYLVYGYADEGIIDTGVYPILFAVCHSGGRVGVMYSDIIALIDARLFEGGAASTLVTLPDCYEAFPPPAVEKGGI